MFDKSVVGTDDFMEMPDSSQNLYFHLSLHADDDGFVDNWKSIMRMTGKKEDDMKILIGKSFILPFDTGVIIIRHWKINNYLRKDRYSETKYTKELKMLTEEENGSYRFENGEEKCLVYQMATSGIHSIDKSSIDKNSIDILSSKHDTYSAIIDYLNKKTDKNFRWKSKKTQDLINARLNEGFTENDFYKVIDNKCFEWLKDNKMSAYLKPETLFSNKFEGYLNQKIIINDIRDTDIDWRFK